MSRAGKFFQLSLFSLLFIHSQTDVHAQRLNLTAGPSFGTGRYGSSDVTRLDVGFAGIGFSMAAIMDFMPRSHVSLSAGLFHNSSTVDLSPLERATGQINIISSSGWSQTGIQLGLTVQSKREGINLFAGLYGGYAAFTSFSFLYEETQSGLQARLLANDMKDVFACLMAGLRYPFTERASFTASVDYKHTNVDYGAMRFQAVNFNGVMVNPPRLNVPLNLITVQVGFSFKLDREETKVMKKW